MAAPRWVRVQEHGRGVPLLLHAGLGQGSWVWRWVLPALAERFRTITFDQRGTGAAPPPPPGRYGIADLADSPQAVAVQNAQTAAQPLLGLLAWLVDVAESVAEGGRLDRRNDDPQLDPATIGGAAELGDEGAQLRRRDVGASDRHRHGGRRVL